MVQSPPPHLSLLSNLGPDDIAGDVGLYQVSWSKVTHSTQQIKRSVPHGDEGVLAEHDGLGAVGRLGELGEHDAGHAGVNEDTDNTLDTHHDDRHWTLRCGGASAVSGEVVELMLQRLVMIDTGVMAASEIPPQMANFQTFY